MEDFDVIEYLSGLTGFIFDKAVLKRIAMERGVYKTSSLDEIDTKMRELLLADLLLAVYMSPNSSASITQTHGAYTQVIGSQTINDKKDIYDIFVSIYKKWGDDKLEVVKELGATLQWLE